MSILLYTRDIIEIEISKYIFIAVILFFSFVTTYEKLLSILLFTLPLMNGLPGNYILPIWCILIISNKLRNKNIQLGVISLWITFIIWEISIYCFYTFDISITNEIGYFSALLLTFSLISEQRNFDYKTPIICFCIGCCVLLVIIYIMYINSPAMIYGDEEVRMGGDAYIDSARMTLKCNANSVGYLSSASLACSFSLFYYKRIRLVLFIALVGIAFYCGMFSVSRTWVLSNILILLFYFIFQKKDRKVGILTLLTLIVAGCYYFSENQLILDMFIDRFESDNIETAGNRTELFASYNDFLLSHSWNLFLGTSAQMYKEVTGLYHSTHNSLQQIWLSYGALGFIIFVAAFLCSLKQNFVKHEYIAFMPLLIVAFFLQSIQILNPYNGLYPIIAAFFILKMVKQESFGK